MATDPLDLLSIDELTESRELATKLMSRGVLGRHVNQHMVALLDDIDATIRRKREAGRFPSRQPEPEPA